MPSSEELGQEFILKHMLDRAEYDPVKAHEYYLRTRQLKGRRLGSAQLPQHRVRGSRNNAQSQHRRVVSVKKNPAQQKREIEAKVAQLQNRLALLRKVLAQLVAEAKKRSGIKTTPKKTHTKTESSKPKKSTAEKLTQHQKAEKAKQQKIAYDKAHPEAKLREVSIQIKAMEEKIATARAELAAMSKHHKPVPSRAGSDHK